MENSWIHIVGVFKKNYCYECANNMLALHYKQIYENGNRFIVCIKAFAGLNFIIQTLLPCQIMF